MDSGPQQQIPNGTCWCGCGERPKSPGARFVSGHQFRSHVRQATNATAEANPKRGKVSTPCARPGCPNLIWHYPSQERLYCSHACKPRAGRAGRTPLALFLIRDHVTSKLSLKKWGEQVGVSAGTLVQLMDGATPLQRTYDRLLDHYGAALPASPTDNARRRQQMHEHRYPIEDDKEASKRGGLWWKKRTQSATHIANRVAARKQNDATLTRESLQAAAKAYGQTLKGRCIRSLVARLRHNPGAERSNWSTWAIVIAGQVGAPPVAVLAIWDEYWQKKHGPERRAGRRTETSRYSAMDQLKASNLTNEEAALEVARRDPKLQTTVFASDEAKSLWVTSFIRSWRRHHQKLRQLGAGTKTSRG